MRSQQNTLKVIIADSSNFSRLVLSDMVQAQPDLEVLDTAADGAGLLNALQNHRPDVVIADYDLPENNQPGIFRQIFYKTGIPVLMVINQKKPSEAIISELAAFGVYDYVLKPAYKLQPQLRTLQVEILEKIRAVHKTEFPVFAVPNNTIFAKKLPELTIPTLPKAVIVIGASTGGTLAVEKLIAGLDENLDACVLVAVHLPAAFTGTFAKRLQFNTGLKVIEAKSRTRLLKGKIIIAPGGKNMAVMNGIGENNNPKINFSKAGTEQYDLPSINLLMESVAALYKENTLGIILTGMGEDGTLGLKAIQQAGGTTIAQNEASSAIFGMAKSAIAHGYVSEVKDLSEIAAYINKFVAELPAAPGKFNRTNIK